MNERIKEHYLQAADEIADLFSPGFFDDKMINDVAEINQKFAELIVRECISQIENLSPGYEDYRNQIEDAFRRDCVDQLKQHFGVEE
jgi:hypothetical protein